ncbi:MAG: NAD(P)H-binding protein [Phycisphaeraceae bacterium]|nr:NAD(P)H-binding protein [Phycisphaeraceae bacterium]
MSSGPRTIAVTGASGFVGRYVVRELVKRGHRVRALVRSLEKAYDALGTASELRKAGIELVVGDVCDARVADELVGPCGGDGAVVHLVGIIREVRGVTRNDPPQTFERMHVRATRTMVEAAQRAGVKRYVQMSALGSGPEGRTEYQRTKWEAERIVRQSGLEWTVVRPSLIHGPDGEFIRMLGDLASGEIAPWFFIPYFVRMEKDDRVPAGGSEFVPAKVQPVYVEDVAKAIGESLERAESIGEVYPLVGSEVLNWQELSEFIRDALPGTNKKMGTWFIPGEHAAVMARVAGKVGLGSLLPFDEGQARMATEDSTADGLKARADLGVEARPFRETVRSYAGRV